MLDSRSSRIAWLAAVALPIVVAAVGSVLQPELFYDRVVWQYFYGPIQADAAGETVIERDGVTAAPGYTTTSTVVYAYYLLLGVVGAVELLDRFDVGNEPRFFYALVPYGFLGGALRVVEDTGSLEAPLAYLFISPVIYVTMFVLTALVLVVLLELESRGRVEDYAPPLAAVGGLAALVTVGYLLLHGLGIGTLDLTVTLATLGLATVVTIAVWYPLDRGLPDVTRATGYMGAVLLWGHLFDAASTGIGVEFLGYGEKQPIVESIIEATGTAWSFFLVKIGIVLLIIWAFDDEFFDDYERLPYLLLVAVLAVGLGPGTRNTLRMTLGV